MKKSQSWNHLLKRSPIDPEPSVKQSKLAIALYELMEREQLFPQPGPEPSAIVQAAKHQHG